jgi:hypothetical protein
MWHSECLTILYMLDGKPYFLLLFFHAANVGEVPDKLFKIKKQSKFIKINIHITLVCLLHIGCVIFVINISYSHNHIL